MVSSRVTLTCAQVINKLARETSIVVWPLVGRHTRPALSRKRQHAL